MRKILIIITILLISYINAFAAGTLYGSVVDSDTNHFKVGAIIEVFAVNCGNQSMVPIATATTNEYGGYDVCLPDGTYVVQATSLDGKTVSPKERFVTISPCEEVK